MSMISYGLILITSSGLSGLTVRTRLEAGFPLALRSGVRRHGETGSRVDCRRGVYLASLEGGCGAADRVVPGGCDGDGRGDVEGARGARPTGRARPCGRPAAGGRTDAQLARTRA